MPNYDNYTVVELKNIARSKGYIGYSKLRKEELIRLLNKKQPVKFSRKKSLKQVAFCFLLYDTVQHLNIWENFFDQDHDGTSTIYSHLKEVSKNTPDWIKNTKVRTVSTNWCGEGLIYAFNQMLKKALQNSNNQYFALISGTDIPLYNYQETYKKICSTTKARITYEKHPGNVFEDRNDIYNGHQWVILNRKTAMDYIKLTDSKNNKAKQFIKDFRSIYRKNGVSVGRKKAVKKEDTTWMGGCPDEIYPINWLHTLYGKNISKYVKNQMTTYTSWDFEKDPDHPEIFNIKTVKKFKKNICDKGHIFARKFTNDAADWIAMNCGTGKKNKNIKKKVQFSKPIVRKELVGRLGNQMFQYASALGIACKKGGEACIIETSESNNLDDLRNSKDDLVNVCKGPFSTCDDNKTSNNFKVIPEKGYAKYDIKHFMTSGNIEIQTDLDQGFLQSYKYFNDIEDVVRKKFTFNKKISTSVHSYMKTIRTSGTKVIGIHARRGDHLELGYMKFPPISYFKMAKLYFKNKYNKVQFIVATNDRKWAKENFEDNDTMIISHSKNAAEDLAILGSCDGVIMSLGTFSWWGGWLCGGDVIYYKNEFVMSHEINKGNVRKSDYYLPNWIGM